MELEGYLAKRSDLLRLAAIARFPAIDPAVVDLALTSKNREFAAKLEGTLFKYIALRQPELHPFLPGPELEDLPAMGALLGHVPGTESAVLIPTNTFAEGVGIFGTTGSGKTHILGLLLSQLIPLGIKVWVFDREKEMAKFLAPFIQTGEVLAINYADFKRNPLEPIPGEAPSEAINRIVSVWRGVFYFRDGSSNLMAKIDHDLFWKLGVFHGQDHYPSLEDLRDALVGMRFSVNSRNAGYWETLVNRVTLLVNQMSTTYECSKGFPIAELLEHNIVFDLMGLSPMLHQFFVQDLVALALAYRERRGETKLINVIVIDEAHRPMAAENRDDLQEDFLSMAARTARKRGIGLILADQTPSEIPVPIISNLGTRIVLRLIDGHSVRAVGASMSLTPDQMAMLPELPPRRAIVHFPAYPSPFMVAIPEITFEPASARAPDPIGVPPAIGWEPRRHTPEEAEHRDVKVDEPPSKGALDYLEHVALHPFLSCTERDRLLGVPGWKGSQVRDELLRHELIRVHRIKTGRRGGMLSLLETTSKGYDLLRSLKVDVSKPNGKGGWVHKFWQHKAREWFSREMPGSQVTIEDCSLGKAVDVGVKANGKRVAVEILVKGRPRSWSTSPRTCRSGMRWFFAQTARRLWRG